jgi:hypothetical protein
MKLNKTAEEWAAIASNLTKEFTFRREAYALQDIAALHAEIARLKNTIQKLREVDIERIRITGEYGNQ